METLTTPKSKPDMEQWYGNIDAGGPSLPKVEREEFSAPPMFVHPAEKPQGTAGPVSRFKMYENY